MSDVEKMNEAMLERLGEIVFKAANARTICDSVSAAGEKNLQLLAAFTELRQMCEFYRPGAPKAKPLMRRCAKTPQTIVQQLTIPSGRCLSAEWLAESTGHRAEAQLYDDERCVCRIEFCDAYQSRNIGFAITRQALRGLVSRAGHMGRYRANKKAMNGGAK